MNQELGSQQATGRKQNNRPLLLVGALILFAVPAYGVYHFYALSQKLGADADTLEKKVVALEGKVSVLEDENEELSEELEDRIEEIDDFDDLLAEVTEGVGVLEETIETDPELLRKYSRVFFLSENYYPSDLVRIDEDHTYAGEEHYIHEGVEPYLADMIEEAAEDDVELLVSSAYRSFGEQSDLNNHYTFVYGAGTANQFSAEQGYSEHQLGTTVDFTTTGTNGDIDLFGSTPSYEWLTENAYKYGFVLSYPEGNSYYQYEPWHWRFVGEALAEDLHDSGAYFYDWEQRKIDTYRSKFFD